MLYSRQFLECSCTHHIPLFDVGTFLKEELAASKVSCRHARSFICYFIIHSRQKPEWEWSSGFGNICSYHFQQREGEEDRHNGQPRSAALPVKEISFPKLTKNKKRRQRKCSWFRYIFAFQLRTRISTYLFDVFLYPVVVPIHTVPPNIRFFRNKFSVLR